MSKKEYVEFQCDYCGKTETIEKCFGFPYHKNWEYLHELNGKTIDCDKETSVKFIIEKDKHFCSIDCLYFFIKKAYKKDITQVGENIHEFGKNVIKI